jgi:hypothetical protein
MGGAIRWDRGWTGKLLDIALCLVIAYMHGPEGGTGKRMDSGVFKERFKASFKVAPVLVVIRVTIYT